MDQYRFKTRWSGIFVDVQELFRQILTKFLKSECWYTVFVDGVVPPSSPAISDREVHAARLGQCHLLGHEPGRNVKQKIMTSVEDPDPYWLSSPGSGSRIKEIVVINQPINLNCNLKKAFVGTYVDMFYDLERHKNIFHLKINVLWRQSLTRNRILFRIFLAPWIQNRIEVISWMRLRLKPHCGCSVVDP